MDRSRVAEYPRPDHVIAHISDTHLIAGDGDLYGDVDAEARLSELLERLETSQIRPDAVIFTGDLADKGQPGAYHKLRCLVEPLADRLGAEVIWVMGNHDNRAALREHLLREAPTMAPMDRVHDIAGLRVIVLDTSVPGYHHGEIAPAQLQWLTAQLAEPAPFGTILAMHHPPIPCVQDLSVMVELRDQGPLATVLRGTDVRSILAGHLHYSTSATFAGIPVSVASASCYSQDLLTAGTRGRDSAQAFNLVHCYPETVVHTVIPLTTGPTVGRFVRPAAVSRELADAGVSILPASRIPRIAHQLARTWPAASRRTD
ncbi:phosphodiesterase [Mycobacterium montefiorense]|uniref:3',5'-cyclic adenosine monophosphate phosphodiesterase CpdA n=1 Tax=Mycobacterium montefiorense TaxID=154654 RepID=A0AA37UVQ4_9MYCO|nr:phosphodiesterase [Mycobacterium montefiorense]GBG39313.1 3',5'-cyclic adenosine monophosphate phosphodiesterase CpdA [Mycobacterium montefiorense]GKU37661.1 3',5'-cyclic adenosine monophosphate phosphodiesterase CpdA [Mycobacterium montefiorense]GKU41866.1 3',5'-cyclic adenosine monophosphate phosphodiesterase CpdA [Mycobacterium montefiorense]GKU45677.1 3',5'-cyclic adenosine monophosphate phosphodiesterase CpdA [Mycobacterium montefiorense]GKU53366.1 3',5'-cyclic adenosine monophosphate 